MWIYEKKLEHPVKIKNKDLKMAKALMAQYGGPDSELSASIRYLSQRYTMPTGKSKALLTDIGTEELAHVEMIAAMIYQLTRNATPEELKAAGLEGFYTQHDSAIYPADANGVPWTAAYIQSMGDPVTDITEDMAAEQKARSTYEHLIDLTDDPDVIQPLKFLWAREIVHFQRFGEALVDVYEFIDSKHHIYIKKEK
jgi:spore coat protein JC